MKGLARFALIWAVSLLLTPYLNRMFQALADRAPRGSLVEEVLRSLNAEYSTSLIRSLGKTMGEIVLGPASRGRVVR